jgi:NAD(P)-dependent dehydrogenase (short-subunit alcohol dehydrogenase family)
MAAAVSHKLSGKVALVFGGTSGIGLATCIRLRDCGVSVTAVGRSGKFSAEGANVEGIAIKSCDVQDRTALGSLFEGSGPVDILVSSATGGDRAVGPFLSMDLDGFQGSFAKLCKTNVCACLFWLHSFSCRYSHFFWSFT